MHHSLSVWHPDFHVQTRISSVQITVFPDGQTVYGNTQEFPFGTPGTLQIQIVDSATSFAIWNNLAGDSEAETRKITSPFWARDHGICVQITPQVPIDRLAVDSFRRPQRIGRRGDESSCEQTPPSLQTLQLWFEAMGAVQRHPANSAELFHAVSKAIVNPGGLDAAMVLARNADNEWEILASLVESPPVGLCFQASIADHVETTRKASVVRGFPDASNRDVLAGPFFRANQEFAGLIYGMREATGNRGRSEIRAVEIQYAQALAESVTSGFTRFEVEREEARAQYVLGRAFSPPLVKAIKEHPELLTPKVKQISVLLADMRGFTELSGRIGSQASSELLSEIMNTLTEEVMKTDGVVLDYYGDGLAAMWNAPQSQEDYIQRACSTAVAMQHRIQELSAQWQTLTGEALRLAVGIASGEAIVGNAGSDMRMKYGPRGTTISLASRLESAAKKLEVGILICDETQLSIPAGTDCHRVGYVKLPGIDAPHHVFELVVESEESPEEHDIFEAYCLALEYFEEERYEEATELLQRLNEQGQWFGPMVTLQEQAEYLKTYGTTNAELSTVQFLPGNRQRQVEFESATSESPSQAL